MMFTHYYYDHRAEDHTYRRNDVTLENFLSSEVGADWAKCCARCQAHLRWGERGDCEDHRTCGLVSHASNSRARTILWLHDSSLNGAESVVREWLELAKDRLGSVKAVVSLTVVEAGHYLRHPPLIVEGRIAVAMREPVKVLASQPAKFAEGVVALQSALTGALEASPTARLARFTSEAYWGNRESAALFNVGIDDSVLLFALLSACNGDSAEMVEDLLWEDELSSLRRALASKSNVLSICEAVRHQHAEIFVPLDLQVKWTTARHRGKPLSTRERRADLGRWMNSPTWTALAERLGPATSGNARKRATAEASRWEDD